MSNGETKTQRGLWLFHALHQKGFQFFFSHFIRTGYCDALMYSRTFLDMNGTLYFDCYSLVGDLFNNQLNESL